jgi:hypothetical protein
LLYVSVDRKATKTDFRGGGIPGLGFRITAISTLSLSWRAISIVGQYSNKHQSTFRTNVEDNDDNDDGIDFRPADTRVKKARKSERNARSPPVANKGHIFVGKKARKSEHNARSPPVANKGHIFVGKKARKSERNGLPVANRGPPS